jgi:hypothetical protein
VAAAGRAGADFGLAQTRRRKQKKSAAATPPRPLKGRGHSGPFPFSQQSYCSGAGIHPAFAASRSASAGSSAFFILNQAGAAGDCRIALRSPMIAALPILPKYPAAVGRYHAAMSRLSAAGVWVGVQAYREAKSHRCGKEANYRKLKIRRSALCLSSSSLNSGVARSCIVAMIKSSFFSS